MDSLEVENLASRPEVADAEAGLAAEIMDGWDPDAVNVACIQNQKERMFIQNATGGEPTWAYVVRAGDGRALRA